jgi:putative transposase
VRKAFKYRLVMGHDQARELDIALETHRRLYNAYLDYRELASSMHDVTLTYVDCSRWFKG